MLSSLTTLVRLRNPIFYFCSFHKSGDFTRDIKLYYLPLNQISCQYKYIFHLFFLMRRFLKILYKFHIL